MRAEISAMVAGRRQVDLARMMPEVLAGVLPRLYPQMLKLAYAHQDAGRKVYIATASSQALADILSDILGFDGGIGQVSEVVDGRFTGRDADLFTYRDGKAERIRKLAGEEGIDLSASWAYSDSESDLPMLRLVGHPVAVNPDRELERVAAEEGWEVLRFEQLGRKLMALGALALMGLVGTAGRTVVSRRAAVPPAEPLNVSRASHRRTPRSYASALTATEYCRFISCTPPSPGDPSPSGPVRSNPTLCSPYEFVPCEMNPISV